MKLAEPKQFETKISETKTENKRIDSTEIVISSVSELLQFDVWMMVLCDLWPEDRRKQRKKNGVR